MIFKRDDINSLNDFYKKQFNDNLDKLILAFTIYFGEEYYELIRERINSILFCWYKDKYLNFLYNNVKYYKGFFLKRNIKTLLEQNNVIIGSNVDISCYKDYLEDDILKQPDSVLAKHSKFFYSNDEIMDIIFFPMIISNDKVLIHEIEHVIVDNVLAYKIDKSQKKYIVKSGLHVMSKSEKLFEEIINERSAVDITKIFHKIKGTILEKKYIVYQSNDYEELFDLIDLFYQKYCNLLKRVRITENYNLLFKYIDKNTYYEYIDFIYKIYQEMECQIISGNKFILNSIYIYIANKYVDNMELNKNKQLKLVKD